MRASVSVPEANTYVGWAAGYTSNIWLKVVSNS